MKAVLADPARRELADSVAYFDAQDHALCESFLNEFLPAVARIEEYSDAWQPLSANTRRCRLRRFPYGLIYRASGETALIIAVAHLHREPDYWRDRHQQ